jgi:hypothetical protein
MLMKFIVTLLFLPIIFLGSVRAQNKNIFEASNLLLFSFQENSFLISGDSIYTVSDDPWTVKAHGLENLTYNFVSQGDLAYLVNSSNGVVYSFEEQVFKRLDQSTPFLSQYGHFPFIRSGKLFTFGGYGLFTHKNIITQFNAATGETALQPTITKQNEMIPGLYKPMGQFTDNSLFIASGEIYNEDSPFKLDIKHLTEAWRFDFDTLEWFYLGQTNEMLSKGFRLSVLNYPEGSLYLDFDTAFSLDFPNNQIHFYKGSQMLNLASIEALTYNPSKGGFYIIKKRNRVQKELLFLNKSEMLGDLVETYPIYTNTIPWVEYGIILIVFSVILYFTLRKKKTLEAKIRSKKNSFYKTLSTKEQEILNILLHSSPEYVSFPTLMQLFNQDLSYDNLKKKLRGTLDSLDQKLMVFFKSKESCMEERKSIEDARVKEVKLKA